MAGPNALLTDSHTKVYIADLMAIGGTEECTATEVEKLGIHGDPGITLTELYKTHPAIAVRLARWIHAGRPDGGGTKRSKPTAPPIAQQIVTLAQELDVWIAAGRPLTTQEQHDARQLGCETDGTGDRSHAPCAYFEDGRCMACGCAAESAPVLAKAFSFATGRGGEVPGMWWMATKECPRDPPVWKSLPVLSNPPSPSV